MKVGDKVCILTGKMSGYAGIITCVVDDKFHGGYGVRTYIRPDLYNYNVYKENELEIGDKDKLSQAVKSAGLEKEETGGLGGLLGDVQEDITIDKAPDALETLKQYVLQLIEQDRRLAFLKEKTKEQSQIKNKLSQALIPDLLNQFNLGDIRLKDLLDKDNRPVIKNKVVISQGCNPSIKDADGFYKWLEEQEEADIIKDTITIYKPTKELRQIIKKYINEKDSEELSDMEYEESRKIHHKTLEAYCRRKLEKGEDFPEKLIEVYLYNKTTLKR